MADDVQIITEDGDNVRQHSFFCYKSKRRAEGWHRKLGWFQEHLAKGLTIHICQEGNRQVGFIECIPGERTWRAGCRLPYGAFCIAHNGGLLTCHYLDRKYLAKLQDLAAGSSGAS